MKAVAKSVAKKAHTGIKTRRRQYVEKLWSSIRSRKVFVSTNPVQLARTRTTTAPSTKATTHTKILSGIRAGPAKPDDVRVDRRGDDAEPAAAPVAAAGAPRFDVGGPFLDRGWAAPPGRAAAPLRNCAGSLS